MKDITEKTHNKTNPEIKESILKQNLDDSFWQL